MWLPESETSVPSGAAGGGSAHSDGGAVTQPGMMLGVQLLNPVVSQVDVTESSVSPSKTSPHMQANVIWVSAGLPLTHCCAPANNSTSDTPHRISLFAISLEAIHL